MLTTLARYKEYDPNLPTGDDQLVTHLISAASDTMEKVCGRKFALTTYDEVYHGTGDQFLFLKARPVVQVRAVRHGLQAALQVQNTDATNYNATVQVTATGLILTYSASATDHATTLLYTTYPTITAMGNAITALGHGWAVTIPGDPFTGWPSADLSAIPITHGARFRTVSLLVHRWYLSNYRMNADLGELSSYEVFHKGYLNWRVKYDGGYATIPDDLQAVCCEVAKNAYDLRSMNTNVASESLGMWSYSQLAQKGFENLSIQSKKTLEQYRDLSIGFWR